MDQKSEPAPVMPKPPIVPTTEGQPPAA